LPRASAWVDSVGTNSVEEEYIAGDELALSFGRSKALSAIATDQVRRFADAAPTVSPLWPIVVEIAGRTVSAWEKLAEREFLPENLNKVIERQISPCPGVL
jgi:hypothetical protein